ncbi:hypothetical protein COS93_01335 [bacterium (Candidatus Gribaldobacteria) CG07_land_8_20_14_0_80_33_18]|uniref:Uncharacterized protein n=1 Tax=bacterium (Candidatus Gribaldobacteria) CG07_land_8_20_14_0_80_33_18 TaxID=2014272 RepID=A0A2M6Z3M6_9BACT|nr:MAG: hypothetical protein COU04_00965 [bacterium (Candidatus Gribaldobacteria) CG10_big_fil_rev_8_21_14_0_10_33_41]PIU46935.1 MAG: hypothetical protein COS93_01335 [bacterium (Candidatus Gribaldobacteria) CG07_land_8_20_14_0_80_33_18]PJA00997.1 MAG: hypothetical protein COX75_00945 [bacterium (Candidatus Gribaldobacteria) CG_4_10_14_0_2_um_filter_33_15]PJB08631.1 MAG: hypothetical protein CO122_01315 [bacterium (Candidatus Gribaldobacteria) CG_4_9_14_3_um_filter_33_9]
MDKKFPPLKPLFLPARFLSGIISKTYLLNFFLKFVCFLLTSSINNTIFKNYISETIKSKYPISILEIMVFLV